MRDKPREKMEGGKRDETFFSAVNVHIPIQLCSYTILKIVGPLSKLKPCTRRVPKIGKNTREL
jgi:hypothetical protein